VHCTRVLMAQKLRWNVRTGFIANLLLLSLTRNLLGEGQDDLTRARQALSSGETTEAIALLENYRKANPTQPDVFDLLGIAYGQANDNERSLAMFKEFVRLDPNRPEAYNNLGAAYLREEKYDQAEAAFRHALRLNPQDLNALYNLGALLNAHHNYSESRPILDRALRSEHSSAIAYEAAVANAGSGNRVAALRILNSMSPPPGRGAVPWLKLTGTLNLDAGNLAAASKALEQAIALNPDQESLYALSLVWLKQNEPERALPLLDRVFDSLSVSVRHVREGALLATYGAYKQALSLFEQAGTEDPTSYDAYYNLAVLHLDKFNNTVAALDAAQRALALKSTGEIHNLLGSIYEAQTRYREALNQYQEAVHLDPEREKFLFDLGSELMLHENYEAAEQVFKSGTKRFPRASKIYLGLGATEFLKGKNSEAVDAFLKAVNLDPDFEPAYIFLGEAFTFSPARSAEVIAKLAEMAAKRRQSFEVQYYYGVALVQGMQNEPNLKNAGLALAALHRAAALRPNDSRVYYQLGEISRIQQHYSEATLYYQKSARLNPDFPEPLYKLGQIYVRMGKGEDAKRMFARHREVEAKAEAGLYHRSGEIQSFVLKMRAPR
jgi:tetratricopeptide (TPR) repeat protein